MFLGKWGETWKFLHCFSHKSCIPRIYLSNEVLSVSNEDCMQNLQPREVDVLTYVRKIGSWSNKIKTNAETKHRRYTIQ
jgi:hypothetical protein